MRWMHRIWLAMIGVLSFVFLQGHNTCTPHTHEPPPPNVILFYTDDQPTSTFTSEFMPKTFQELVNKGVNFTKSYASTPVCCPDRAGTYSGNWTHNNGVAFNGDTETLSDAPEVGDLPNGGVTAFDWNLGIAAILDSNKSYHTALFGKVMNSHEALCTNVTPPATCTVPAGWDEFVAFTQDGFNFLGESSDWYAEGPTGSGTPADYYFSDNGTMKSASQVRDDTPVTSPFDCEQEKICHYADQSTCTSAPECTWNGTDCDVTSCTTANANDYSTDLVRDLFLEWVDTVPTSEPLFAVLGFYAPHFDRGFYNLPPAARHDGDFEGVAVPNPPSFDETDKTDKPTWVQTAPSTIMTSGAGVIPNRTNYWQRVRESLLAVDEAIFATIAAMDARGQSNNTIFIFLSDNGYLMGEHSLGMKNLPYEESAKVPMAIRWLDKRPLGFPEVTSRLVTNCDIAPTLASAASVSGQSFNGSDLTPIIDATVSSWRSTVLSEGWWPDSQGNPFPSIIAEHPDWAAVWRNDGWKYVEYDNDTNELYNLSADPYELSNEIANPDHASILSTLQSELATLRAE